MSTPSPSPSPCRLPRCMHHSDPQSTAHHVGPHHSVCCRCHVRVTTCVSASELHDPCTGRYIRLCTPHPTHMRAEPCRGACRIHRVLSAYVHHHTWRCCGQCVRLSRSNTTTTKQASAATPRKALSTDSDRISHSVYTLYIHTATCPPNVKHQDGKASSSNSACNINTMDDMTYIDA